MEKYVNVLISTYNGEHFIEEQLESIKNQTYPYIHIYVRDDGSSDRTKDILKNYEKRGEIRLLPSGPNLGYGGSFLTLLKEAENGDYWAFCDQDDIWLPQKVEWSVEWLETQDPQKPLLIGNAYQLVDETMEQVIGEHIPPDYRFDFRRSLTDCLYQGFVMTFNRPLRDLMLQGDIEKLLTHDWWANILAVKFGKTYFDPRIAAKHRRLDQSISVMTLRNKFRWFFRTFQTGKSDIRSCAQEYDRIFGQKIDDKDSRIARWFTHDSYCLPDALKKAFYPKRWRPIVSSEIAVRFLMLTGKL